MGSVCTKGEHKNASSVKEEKEEPQPEEKAPAEEPSTTSSKGFATSGFGLKSLNKWDLDYVSHLVGHPVTSFETSRIIHAEDGRTKRTPILLSDGSVYFGQWKGTHRDGFGHYFVSDGSQYIGFFLNDLFHGHGEMQFLNGDSFKGLFKHGLRNGKGILNYSSGDMYEGMWKNGVRMGYGVERYLDGSVYMGGFRNNRRFGKGELKTADGTIYEGSFNNGISGLGKMYWTSGESYQGYFKNGIKHGKGTTMWKIGPVVSQKGTYKNGKMNGLFRTVLRDGTVVDGFYVDDTLVEQPEEEAVPAETPATQGERNKEEQPDGENELTDASTEHGSMDDAVEDGKDSTHMTSNYADTSVSLSVKEIPIEYKDYNSDFMDSDPSEEFVPPKHKGWHKPKTHKQPFPKGNKHGNARNYVY
ncbi:MORN repeat domain containing protein [Theileria equi strain WA]|uniref:MORN repeat domain containing protein n=1 Tax=Theileria equi strain WA TaxID=1537102 RepID=L1LBV5_THEEQ|nr:MORN repeat domain containing protein [Theileria equi strain WA]EKX72806.1 MORN repeat domain containing protein [Theileria equi strain WA]|eukprot:XP_004832258.1 MORN repeat domain containing protein [Theileria equi strain WA]